ncbi:MAG: hypothetical protein ACKVS7_03640 [Gemmatimonadaceae bacterium]
MTTSIAAVAAAEWHERLSADAGLAAASWAQLSGDLAGQDIVFGGRPLCTVLRPRLFTPDEWARYRTQCAALLGAFRAAKARAVADPAARAQFRLEDWEESLFVAAAAQLDDAPFEPLGRLDTFASADHGFSVTEYNGETPAGPFYNDAIAAAFEQLPITRVMARRWWLRPLAAGASTIRPLLDAWERFRGLRSLPRVAILDWPEVPTQSEFRLAMAQFRARGIPCEIGDPRECEFSGGVLRLNGTPIDVVYKRVLFDELVTRAGLETPVLQAMRAGAVLMVNGPRGKLLHKKASLAVLSDERNADWFDADAQAAIRSHVPWTRLVEARKTRGPDGPDIDLLAWCAENRDRLVLKPSEGYGGHGIVLGWTVDATTWNAALAGALTAPTIVQQRVSIPRDVYPSIEGGALALIERQVDTAPYVIDGRWIEGALSRLSTAELLNVTAGGGSQTPTYLVDRRP